MFPFLHQNKLEILFKSSASFFPDSRKRSSDANRVHHKFEMSRTFVSDPLDDYGSLTKKSYIQKPKLINNKPYVNQKCSVSEKRPAGVQRSPGCLGNSLQVVCSVGSGVPHLPLGSEVLVWPVCWSVKHTSTTVLEMSISSFMDQYPVLLGGQRNTADIAVPLFSSSTSQWISCLFPSTELSLDIQHSVITLSSSPG